METPKEILISVDVETAGPYPGRYSLLSIGACVVSDPTQTFYVELQPLNSDIVADALSVTGLRMGRMMCR